MKSQFSVLMSILDSPENTVDLNTVLKEIDLMRQLGIKSAGFFADLIRRLDAMPAEIPQQPSLLNN